MDTETLVYLQQFRTYRVQFTATTGNTLPHIDVVARSPEEAEAAARLYLHGYDGPTHVTDLSTWQLYL